MTARPTDSFQRVATMVALARRNPVLWTMELWHYPYGREADASPEAIGEAFRRAAGEP